MAPRDEASPPTPEDLKAAAGRPFGVGTSYGAAALRLFDNGYEPLPVVPGAKRPALSRWTGVAIDVASVTRWTRRYPDHGIGLRTGALVGIDIDVLDPELAHHVDQLVRSQFQETLMRVGKWPKRLLLYRTKQLFPKMSVQGVEVLGAGQQFVAFGIHPETGHPYHWPDGETPLEIPFEKLPLVDAAACEQLLAEVSALLPPPAGVSTSPRRRGLAGSGAVAPVRDADGRVADGRDAWLSRIAFHAVSDAVARREPLDQATLATAVWERFAATSNLSRPRKGGAAPYTRADAARKLGDKLRLLAEGRLPTRERPRVEAEYRAPTLSAGEARQELDRLLRAACRDIETWYTDSEDRESPCIGIRATVGLGKSLLARRHLMLLRDRLIAAGAPSRIAVFAPSHALAEEVAVGWRAEGMRVAVLLGYEARHPMLHRPMCRDIAAVRLAVQAGNDIHSTACSGTGDRRCKLIDSCLKQHNRTEVQAADVVVAAYDALYSGFAIDPGLLGVLLIDEGCWQRAEDRTAGTWDSCVPQEIMRGRHGKRQEERLVEDAADLMELRGRALAAFNVNRPGALSTDALRQVDLTEADCLAAVRLEERALRDPGLYPGMPSEDRVAATVQTQANERARFRADVWRAMAGQLAGYSDGKLRVLRSAAGAAEVEVTGVKAIHPNFRGKPILHLDATLRPDLARTVLPRLTVSEIDAAAPHMSLRLVTGPFGKSALCFDPRAGAEENQRRANRLAECVTYVNWRVKQAGDRVLVITYKDCETAFLDNSEVAVVHFNALAGLDVYRDVAVLIVIGRPLPRDTDLELLHAGYFGRGSTGGYHRALRGVRMRDGSSRTVRVQEHKDTGVELLRAAVCDDELIQAIGRGRGVNRTETNPLEVHVLANVALPLVHDRVLTWETVSPDIVQRMLLAGVAVDSPADAAALHPGSLRRRGAGQESVRASRI